MSLQSLLLQAGGWFGLMTAAIAVFIAFAELTNDTLKKDVIPLGTLTWATDFFHSNKQNCESSTSICSATFKKRDVYHTEIGYRWPV